MHAALRIGLVVLGAALVVYGAASLTGGWLGLAPWEHERVVSVSAEEHETMFLSQAEYEADVREHGRDPDNRYPLMGIVPGSLRRWYTITEVRVREPFEAIGWLVMATGASIVAVGAWPRRRRRDAKPADAATTSPAGTPAS